MKKACVMTRVRLASLLLLALHAPLHAQEKKPDTKGKTLTVDAHSGKVTGSQDVSVGDRVRVRVTNINPFQHLYRFVERDAVTYSESAIAAFGKLAFGFTLPDPLPKATPNAAADLPARLAELRGGTDAMCSESADTLRTRPTTQAFGVGLRLATLIKLRSELHTTAEEFRSSSSAWLKSTANARRVLQSDTSTSSNLQNAAATIASSIDTLLLRHSSDTLGFPGRVSAVIAETQSLSATLDALAGNYPSCKAFPELRATVAQVAADSAVLRSISADLKGAVQAAGKVLEATSLVANDPQRLEASKWLGPYDDPARVTVDIQRRAVGDTLWRTIASPTLRFGGRRQFAIVIGILGSKIPSKEYSVNREYANPPANAADSVVTRVRAGNARDWLVTPTIGLATRLFHPGTRALAVHSIFGVGTSVSDGKATPNYHLGAAVSLAQERVLISVGLTSALAKGLGRGVQVDAPIPAAQANVPTAERRMNRLGVALLYRAY